VTTYTEDSPEPGPEVTQVWDRDGTRWQRNGGSGPNAHDLEGYPDGWHTARVPTTRPTRFPNPWEDLVAKWAPFDDRLDDSTSPTSPAGLVAQIETKIRHDALVLAERTYSALPGSPSTSSLEAIYRHQIIPAARLIEAYLLGTDDPS
jgi:hypothetical protein